MKIKLLSDNTINRIAAGEVIDRPSSVIKELIENAIDADSTKIDIILEQAGKNLIIVSDDGVGMSKEDLEIAIERHTTSKLDELDLLNIHTFGFRGEALPSIGSVSKMLIVSRVHGAEKAYQIQLSAGQKKIKPTIHNEGTKIEIRDLFFATPGRLKFLRSDKVELTFSVDIIKKFALSHPKISVSLCHDGKNIMKVKGQNGDFNHLLKHRIIDILGYDFIENSVHVNLQRSKVSVYGFTSLPTFNRASTEDQFLFVNKRPVKDKLLQIALRLAYQDYLARDRYPVSVLFLQIDPQMIDVNVHPAKTEVRFHDPNNIRKLLISSIKDALTTRSHIVSTSVATNALVLFRKTAVSNNFVKINKVFQKPNSPGEYSYVSIFHDINGDTVKNSITPKYNCNSNIQQRLINNIPHTEVEVLKDCIINKFQQLDKSVSSKQMEYRQTIVCPHNSINTQRLCLKNEAEYIPDTIHNGFTLGAAQVQLHGTYIISQTTDSIIIVDQHAAHERLGYEKIKQMISNNGLIKQGLLIPEIVELPDIKRADLLCNKKEDLFELGLSIEKFGERSIVVSEVPSLLGSTNINQLTQDLADNLSDLGENISLIQLIEHVTETYACHYAIRAGRKLSYEEMNELLRQMEKTPFSAQCNHGRPTYIEFKLKDIERSFGRR